MSDYIYTKKHDTSKVQPFKTDPGKSTFAQFTKLLMAKKLNEVAFWFEQKNLKNPDFKYFYEHPQFPAPKRTYKMSDLLCHALETAISKNDRDMVDFLLFDPLVKNRHILINSKTKSSNLGSHGFQYGNCLLNFKNKDLLTFCIQQGVTGSHPFMIEFPPQWLDEAFEGLPINAKSLSYLKEIENGYKKWLPIKMIKQEYPNEYEALLITQKFIALHEQHKQLKEETGLIDHNLIKEDIKYIDEKLQNLDQKQKDFLKRIQKQQKELLQKRKSLEEKLNKPQKPRTSRLM